MPLAFNLEGKETQQLFQLFLLTNKEKNEVRICVTGLRQDKPIELNFEPLKKSEFAEFAEFVNMVNRKLTNSVKK